MSVHSIRLRGPWQYEWLSPTEREPAAGRVSLPLEWREIFGSAGGRVRFQRTFHRPTNLEPGSHVDVVFEGIGGEAEIAINGHALEKQVGEDESSTRCRITEPLEPTNKLQVDLQFDPAQTEEPGGLWGTVALEILE